MVLENEILGVPVDAEVPVNDALATDTDTQPVLDDGAASEPSQDFVADIVQGVQQAVSDMIDQISDPVDEEPVDEDTVVDGVMSSYYGGYMSGYLDGLQESAGDQVLAEAPLESADVQVLSLSPITSSAGLKGVLLDVIGPYDNIVTQYRYQQSGNSYYSYVNEITPDWPWIGSCLLFIVLVSCIFKLIGRMLGWMK